MKSPPGVEEISAHSQVIASKVPAFDKNGPKLQYFFNMTINKGRYKDASKVGMNILFQPRAEKW